MNAVMKNIVNKWAPLLQGLDTDEKVKSTAVMLENQSQFIERQYLGENVYSVSTPNNLGIGGVAGMGSSSVGNAGGTPTGIARYKQIAIPMVRRIFPELLAHKLVGVQPMSGPVGLAYALRFRSATARSGGYGVGTELGYNNIDSEFSGSYTTEAGEGLNEPSGTFGSNGSTSRQVGMTIEQKEIVARTRKLKAIWSIEVEQDLSAMHSLDFEEEMMDLMAYEIAQEIDRELVGRIINAAKAGGEFTWSYGSVGQPTSGAALGAADGRWQQEKFRTLYTTILNAAEEIGRSTRMGPGNWCIVSPRVAVALQSLPDFQFSPVKGQVNSLKFGVAEVGSFASGIKVYRDTFAYGSGNGSTGSDFVVVGYKGSRESETGIIYCPYIPVMFQKAIGQDSFSPRAGVMTRYGILDQLFGSQLFYRYINVDLGQGVDGSTTSKVVPTTGNYAYDSGLNSVIGS
jgi:hypothetical protein